MKKINDLAKLSGAFIFALLTFFVNTVFAAEVNPTTGDDGMYLLYLGLFFIFGIAIVRILLLMKKKK